MQGGPAGPYTQSECLNYYEKAAQTFKRTKQVICLCLLSKKTYRMPRLRHPGEEGPPYPGTCRDKGYTFDSDQTSVAWRFRPNPGPVNYEDTLWGPQTGDVASKVGDFVIKRKDGLWAYHLAVVVDDIRQGRD